jgi:hypothetical protein
MPEDKYSAVARMAATPATVPVGARFEAASGLSLSAFADIEYDPAHLKPADRQKFLRLIADDTRHIIALLTKLLTAAGNGGGRPMSTRTIAVVGALGEHPEMADMAIADMVTAQGEFRVSVGYVHDVRADWLEFVTQRPSRDREWQRTYLARLQQGAAS